MNLMKFCPDCNNLLYHRENKEHKILLNSCRTCHYTEVAGNNGVYRNEVQQLHERPLTLRDAYADPTLPSAKGLKCLLCGHPRVAFFLANPRQSMTRTYACCNSSCGHNWRDDAQSIV